jgi:hypothetical protein
VSEQHSWAETIWKHVGKLTQELPFEPKRVVLLIENWEVFQEPHSQFVQQLIDQLRGGASVGELLEEFGPGKRKKTRPHFREDELLRRGLRLAEGETEIQRILVEEMNDRRAKREPNDESWDGFSIPDGVMFHFTRFY